MQWLVLVGVFFPPPLCLRACPKSAHKHAWTVFILSIFLSMNRWTFYLSIYLQLQKRKGRNNATARQEQQQSNIYRNNNRWSEPVSASCKLWSEHLGCGYSAFRPLFMLRRGSSVCSHACQCASVCVWCLWVCVRVSTLAKGWFLEVRLWRTKIKPLIDSQDDFVLHSLLRAYSSFPSHPSWLSIQSFFFLCTNWPPKSILCVFSLSFFPCPVLLSVPCLVFFLSALFFCLSSCDPISPAFHSLECFSFLGFGANSMAFPGQSTP